MVTGAVFTDAAELPADDDPADEAADDAAELAADEAAALVPAAPDPAEVAGALVVGVVEPELLLPQAATSTTLRPSAATATPRIFLVIAQLPVGG